MKDARLVHTLDCDFARVEVRMAAKGREVTIVLLPNTPSGQQLPLTFITWVCQSPAEALQISKLLRTAAALGQWIESGGSVEHWLSESALRQSFDAN